MADSGNVTRLVMSSGPAAEPVPRTDVRVEETATGVKLRTTDTPAVVKPGEEKLLAGKFKTAEELESGYVELQKKLGEVKPVEPPVVEPVKEPATPIESTAEQKAYAATIGASATKIAGTADDVDKTLTWARGNVSDAEKASFDSALASGDVGLVEMAFTNLRSKYVAAMGEQGSRVTGVTMPGENGSAAYASREDMLAVIRSPAYKKGDTRVHAEHRRRLQTTKFGVANGGI